MNDFEKLPPQSLEAEKCTLGAMMLSNSDAAVYADVVSLICAEDFYRADNALVFRQLVELQRAGKSVDAVVLRERLISNGTFERVGGMAYIAELLNSVPSAAHCTQYAEIVREKAIMRELVQAGNEICRRCYSPARDGESAANLVSEFASKIAAIAMARATGKIRRLGEVAVDWLDGAVSGENMPLLQTGFTDVDQCMGGFPIGGLSLIGGRPGMGKSCLSKCIAINLARQGTQVGYVSIEETESKIAANAVSNIGNIDSQRTRQAKMTAQDFNHAQAAIQSMFHWPLFIADYPTLLRDVEAALSQMVHKHGCRIVFVDHIHIISSGDGRPHENRTVEVTNISRGLKSLAKRLNIALVALCQLNRGMTRDDYAGKPTLRDFRDSGALEADGDVILGVFREDWNRQQRGDPPSEFDDRMQLLMLKSKDTELADISLRWDGAHQRVCDWMPGNLS